jgi:hypothetical protein
MHASISLMGYTNLRNVILCIHHWTICSSVADTNLRPRSYSHLRYKILQNQKLLFLVLC